MSCMSTPKKSRTQDRHKDYKMLRLPLDLYRQLAEIAKRNHRPTTWEGVLAIERHIEQQRDGKPAD